MIDEIPSFDIKLMIGEFNAKPSGDRRGIPSSIGPHGSADDINDNAERLLSLCRVSSGLSIGNAFFQTQAHPQEDLDISRWEHFK